MRYRVHRFELRMTQDQGNLERFLNDLEGDVVAIIPNMTLHLLWKQRVDFVLVVERVGRVPGHGGRRVGALRAPRDHARAGGVHSEREAR